MDFKVIVLELISNLPKVSGASRSENLYIAPDVDKLLTESEKIAKI